MLTLIWRALLLWKKSLRSSKLSAYSFGNISVDYLNTWNHMRFHFEHFNLLLKGLSTHELYTWVEIHFRLKWFFSSINVVNVPNWGYDMRGGQYPKNSAGLSLYHQIWSYKYTFQRCHQGWKTNYSPSATTKGNKIKIEEQKSIYS